MNICIFTDDFPSKNRHVYTFVKQIVDEFARKGNNCYVISPFPIIHYRRFCKPYTKYHVDGGNSVVLIRPNYLTFSHFKLGKFVFSKYFFSRALSKALKHIPCVPDVVYAHFWIQGMKALQYSKSIGRPLFVATGESDISKVIPTSYDPSDLRQSVAGVICVSSKNKRESIDLGLATDDKCRVIPNAVNDVLFKRMDKASVRSELGLPKSGFIIAYVGWFNERKGVYRLVQALNSIQGDPVYSIFIGGDDALICKNVLVKGRFAHESIPKYLNAADVFVLPTLKEGCCNAIVEAMACGLPVISSNLDFNLDVLDESNSILIDPLSIEEIQAAIIKLRDNPELRSLLAEGALITAKHLTLGQRADSILQFIKEKKEKYENTSYS